MVFCDPLVHAPTLQALKIDERVVAYNAREMDMYSRIDEREEERRMWKAYHRSVHKYPAGISKALLSKGSNSS